MQIGDGAWMEANGRYLHGAIARVQAALEQQKRLLEKGDEESAEIAELPPSKLSPPTTLEQLCQAFGLNSFERDVVLLCAGMELVPGWEQLCVAAQGNPQRNYPTFQLAMTALGQPQWQALQPQAALRRWQLVELGPGNALSHSLLRLDEQVLHALLGGQGVDERLARFQIPTPRGGQALAPAHQQLVDQMTQVWVHASEAQPVLPSLQLWGEDAESKQAIALAVCAQLGLARMMLAAEMLPTDPQQLTHLCSLCDREWWLHERVLILNCDCLSHGHAEAEQAIARLLDILTSPVIVLTRERRPQRSRLTVAFAVARPHPTEQRLLWQRALGELSEALNGQIDQLVSHFNLNAAAIQGVCLRVQSDLTEAAAGEPTLLTEQLWTYCRDQARPRLDDLAQQIRSPASWEDLVLAEREMQVLKEMVVHVRQRTQVYEAWGFGGKSGRGLGIAALFAGTSGTGKTLAAEVLANTLQLDLYRIDLSSVVSKYIGETEKNLRRVFDAAEGGGAVLLFDEADALFGKRSEVKDSHDRHANIEVSYLLQRMEAYRGLAILTTNLKSALDQAFLRRIRFIVQFPFPNVSQRAEIWRRAFPPQTPTQELDYKKLAMLSVAGGNIANIALNAAFVAAEANEPVKMQTILRAVQSEYVKLERPLTDGEVRGWVQK
ncbi:MAG: ATP-binding protein [Leptolyngbya sp. SIO1E4]|nr:ATP-binding protein [Leptolyngbya sp. SIO1E4]